MAQLCHSHISLHLRRDRGSKFGVSATPSLPLPQVPGKLLLQLDDGSQAHLVPAAEGVDSNISLLEV